LPAGVGTPGVRYTPPAMPIGLPIICILSAAVLSALVTTLVRRWALQYGFVDRPGGHKAHAGEIALGGGIAIVAATVLPMLGVLLAARLLAAGDQSVLPAFVQTHLGGIVAKSSEGTAIVAGAIVLHILGLIDDIRPLRAGVKFVAQTLIALGLAVVFDLRILTLLGYVPSVLVTVVWIVLIINAFNFMDNMDGLATGVAIIVASVYSVVATLAGQIFVPACCWLLVGALLGFLPFNIQPASVFLGDSGSTVIGYLIAVFTVLTTFFDASHGQQPIGVVAPLVVLAVPLYDTAGVIVRRWREGRPVWVGDRRHFSHRLVSAGMSTRRAVGVIWIATLATSLPALILPTASWPVAVGILAETAAIVVLIALLESAGGHERATH
jgi:UDP-GlcNAc:undecaprenyl-phosphate GlcNAc-1-phosphate transferase